MFPVPTIMRFTYNKIQTKNVSLCTMKKILSQFKYAFPTNVVETCGYPYSMFNQIMLINYRKNMNVQQTSH